MSQSDNVNSKLMWSNDLCEFIEDLDTYTPTIPEAVVKYNLQKGGCGISDHRIVKLVSLASDKFLTEIINEAKEFNAIRKTKSNKRKAASNNLNTLEMFDLERSLSKHKLYLRRRGNK